MNSSRGSALPKSIISRKAHDVLNLSSHLLSHAISFVRVTSTIPRREHIGNKVFLRLKNSMRRKRFVRLYRVNVSREVGLTGCIIANRLRVVSYSRRLIPLRKILIFQLTSSESSLLKYSSLFPLFRFLKVFKSSHHPLTLYSAFKLKVERVP